MVVGGSQFPLTHVQLAPGWTVVQPLVEVVGATQLPFTQVHPVPGEAVVQVVVVEPVVCSTSCAMTRLNASLATTSHRPFAAPPAAWGWLARVVPDTVAWNWGVGTPLPSTSIPHTSSFVWLWYTARYVALTGLYATPMPLPPPLTAIGSAELPTNAPLASKRLPLSIQPLPLNPQVTQKY